MLAATGHPEAVEAILRDGELPDSDPHRPVLLHADLIPGNLLHQGQTIVTLIDFGTLTTGRPEWDLTCAWWILDAAGRERLREGLAVSDDSWALGRVIALSQAVRAHYFYTPRGHQLGPQAGRAINEIVADPR